eukprot:1763718-Amphidinium_carterae.1
MKLWGVCADRFFHSSIKVPRLIQAGRKLRAVLVTHVTARARDDIVSALVGHKAPERLELMLTWIRDELLEALGSQSTRHSGGAGGPYSSRSCKFW